MYLMFLCMHQMAHRSHILRTMKQTLLFTGLLEVAMSTAAAVGQLHGRNGDGSGFIHVDDRHHFLGGGLTTWHLDMENDEREEESGMVN